MVRKMEMFFLFFLKGDGANGERGEWFVQTAKVIAD